MTSPKPTDTTNRRNATHDPGPEMPADPSQRVNWVVGTDDPAEKRARYDKWAENYDADLLENDGYQAPEMALQAVLRHVPASARILDAGCGTGLVGELLNRAGYTDLVGGDYSEQMLAVAGRKEVYNTLDRIDLAAALPFGDNTFDAVVTVGLPMIVPGACMQEFARITRPGGHIVYSAGDTQFSRAGWDKAVVALTAGGRLEEVSPPEPYQAFTRVNTDVAFMVAAWRVSG